MEFGLVRSGRAPVERGADVAQMGGPGDAASRSRRSRPFVREPTHEVRRVPPGDPGLLATLGELASHIGARRIQQLVSRRLPIGIGSDEGLGNQPRQCVDDVLWAHVGVAGDGLGVIKGERSHKDRQAAQHCLILRGGQVMAPVQRRAQCPVARHRRAPSLPQKFEPAIEQRGCPFQAVDTDAPSRQLQGEGDTVDFRQMSPMTWASRSFKGRRRPPANALSMNREAAA